MLESTERVNKCHILHVADKCYAPIFVKFIPITVNYKTFLEVMSQHIGKIDMKHKMAKITRD